MKSQQERHEEAQTLISSLGPDFQTSTHPGAVRFAEVLNEFVRNGTKAAGYLAVSNSQLRIMYALFPEVDRPSWVKNVSSPQGPVEFYY